MKLKQSFQYFSLLVLLYTSQKLYAIEISVQDSLNTPNSSAAAMSGTGAAAPGDMSVADVNPASLAALKPQYSFFGNTDWQDQINTWEAGVFDSITTPVSALLKIRQTAQGSDQDINRKVTGSLAYHISETNLSLGLSGYYEQLELTGWKSSQAEHVNGGGGLGALYEVFLTPKQPIFIGVGMNNLFDKYTEKKIDIGASAFIHENYFTLSSDAVFGSDSGFQKGVLSLGAFLNEFINLKGSLGYDPKLLKAIWASGVFFDFPILHLSYTVAKIDSNDTTTLRQTLGCSLAFSL